MNALVLTSMAALSTAVGGCSIVLLRRQLHLLMAFGAGVLFGAASLDLIPAALSAAVFGKYPAWVVFGFAALGALLFHGMRHQSGATIDLRKKR